MFKELVVLGIRGLPARHGGFETFAEYLCKYLVENWKHECESNPNITDLKRESLFIGMLETVDKDDAKILIGMKDKEIPVKNVTQKLTERAFPDLFK